MIAAMALNVLIKSVLVWWVAAGALLTWILFDGPPEAGAAMAYCLVLACTGTICWFVRHATGPGIGRLIDRLVDKLVDALIASRPPGETEAVGLRLVETQETGSRLPAPRRSVL